MWNSDSVDADGVDLKPKLDNGTIRPIKYTWHLSHHEWHCSDDVSK